MPLRTTFLTKVPNKQIGNEDFTKHLTDQAAQLCQRGRQVSAFENILDIHLLPKALTTLKTIQPPSSKYSFF